MQDEIDQTDDTELDDETGEGGESEDDWEPPTREEFEQLQRQLARARKEATKRRKRLAQMREGQDDDADEADEEPRTTDRRELKRLLADAEARVEARYKPALVKQAAKAALAQAGFAGEVTSRTMRMLDLDELEVDEDGEVAGLDEAIEELKEDMPQLFRKPRATGRPATGGRSLDAGNKKVAKKPESFADKLVAQFGG